MPTITNSFCYHHGKEVCHQIHVTGYRNIETLKCEAYFHILGDIRELSLLYHFVEGFQISKALYEGDVVGLRLQVSDQVESRVKRQLSCTG